MQGSVAAIDRYRQEYCLYRAIMENNELVEHSSPERVVYTTQGRAVSTRVFSRVGELLQSGVPSDEAFLTATDEVLGNQWGRPVFGEDNTQLSMFEDDFENITGFRRGSETAQAMEDGVEHGIPISPFDSRFAMRDSVWDAGSAMLFVQNAALDGRGLSLDQLESGRLTRGIRLSRRRVNQGRDGEPPVTWQDAGRIYGPEDMSGLSAVRPYMDMQSYREMVAQVSQSYGPYFRYDPDIGGFADVMRNSRGHDISFERAEREGRVSATMAAAVMRDRMSKGRSYEVRAERLGQIELVDDISNMAIRLFDEPGEGYWAGRIRDIQTGVYYRWQLSTSSGSQTYDRVPDQWKTGGLAVRAFSWVCGENAVMRGLDGTDMAIGDPSLSFEYGVDARIRAHYVNVPIRDERGNVVYDVGGKPVTERQIAVDGNTGEALFRGNFRQHGSFFSSTGKTNVTIGRGRVSPQVGYGTRRDGSRYVEDIWYTPSRDGDMVGIQLSGDYSGWSVDYTRYQPKGDSPDAVAAAQEWARNDLRTAIETARAELADEIDVEALIESAMAVASGYDDDLNLADGCISDEVVVIREDLLGMLEGTVRIEGYDAVNAPEPGTPEFVVDASTYVREAAARFIDERVGEYNEVVLSDGSIAVQGTFDIVGVSRYNVEQPETRNRDSLVYAMRCLGMSASDFDEKDVACRRLADRLVQFQEDNAVSLAQLNDPGWLAERNRNRKVPQSWDFRKQAMETVRDAVRTSMSDVSDEDIRIDANGIIRYVAHRSTGAAQEGQVAGEPWGVLTVTGEVGPVFERSDRGTFVTEFAASDNYELVPKVRGYMAPPSGDGEGRYERFRGVTFEDDFLAALRSQVSLDLRRAKRSFTEVGTPWSMSRAWHNPDHGRLPIDHDERMMAQGMDLDVDAARIETMRSTVSFGSRVGRDAGIVQHLKHLNSSDEGERFNDNPDDLYHLYGFMGVADEAGDGLFDPVWPSSAGSQPYQRVLREGASLHRDAPPTQVEPDVDNRIALNKLFLFDHEEYNSWARVAMAGQGLMASERVAEDVHVALSSFGGWTIEDGVVMSSEQALRCSVLDDNGELRPLEPGDKVSDVNGNKGVVGLVVDRSWTEEEARERDLYKEWRFFVDNPDVDVVMSPFSVLSRLNGGTLREAVDKGAVGDLATDAGVVEGGIGKVNMLVHDKTVEHGINEGRHYAGWQMLGVLYATECYGVLEELGGASDMGESRFSETLIATTGSQIGDDHSTVAFDPTSSAPLDLPDMDEFFEGRNKQNHMKNQFIRNLETSGGILELPCELRFPQFPSVQFAEGDVPDGLEGLVVERKIGKETVYELPFGGGTLPKVEGIWDAGDARTPEKWHAVSEGTWALPVVSRQMRDGTTTDDDVPVHHYLTKTYASIYRAAIDYARAKADGDDEVMEKTKRTMQRGIDSIGNTIATYSLSGKFNAAKSEMMRRELKGAPYCVWSGDPRAGIDEVHMNPALMKSMGLGDGDTAIVARHPVLKEGCMVAMTVVADERIRSISVNPGTATLIGGDFDGDKVVVYRPRTEAAIRDMEEKLAVREFLIDRSIIDANGMHPLAYGMGGDIASALARKPELAELVADITRRLNDAEKMEHGLERTAVLDSCMSELQQVSKSALEDEYGQSAISFSTLQSSLQSVLDTSIAKHVKGSMSKFDDLCKYVGAVVEYGKDDVAGEDCWKLSSCRDVGHTLATREDMESVQKATTAKQDYTGQSGKEMQHIIAAFETDSQTMRAGLRVVEKLYQKTLDWKHSGEEAMREAPFIDVAKSCLNARMVDMGDDGDGDGRVIYDASGNEATVDRDRYIKQVLWCYDRLGLKCNPSDVETVAHALSSEDGAHVVGIRDKALRDASFVPRCAMSEQSADFAIAIARGENLYGPEGGMMSHLKCKGPHASGYMERARAHEPAVKVASKSEKTVEREVVRETESVAKKVPTLLPVDETDSLQETAEGEFPPLKVDRAKASVAKLEATQQAALSLDADVASMLASVRSASRGVAVRRSRSEDDGNAFYGDDFTPMKVDRSKLPQREQVVDGGESRSEDVAISGMRIAKAFEHDALPSGLE